MAEAALPRPEWNQRGGDRDQVYRFGKPGALLSEIERARLLVRQPSMERELTEEVPE